MMGRGRWRIGLLLVLLATVVRLCWALAVPTIPVGDFATYRESAIYLAEFGHFDHGFVYMPGLVLLLAVIHDLGGDVLADKLLGVAFGGLAAAPLYLVAARLIDNGRSGDPGQWSRHGSRQREAGEWKWTDAPVALTAGLAYALWPAGIAMSSVIGTDVPTAALLLLALALLCEWGGARPLLAAVGFGAAMGLATYFRAVALPLTLLSAGYWIFHGARVRQTVTRTAISIAVTVLLLVPWGLRNQRQSGEFYLTDSHGGITALMGNYPNTEGTYARSLGTMFHELTGRTFLMEPHRQTDRAAYAIAKQWIAFDPAWTAGMVAMRAERLLALEHGLLYWPIYRPGVVPPVTAAWFNQRRPTIAGLADLFYLLFVLGLVAGLAFAVTERRWMVLVPLPFAVALAGTYALFVAEPRYRLTSEVLLFPMAAFGVVRLCASAGRAGGSLLDLVARKTGSSRLARFDVGPDKFQMSLAERRGLVGTLIALSALVLTAVVVARGGSFLRDRHRWAATIWRVDGRPRLGLWRSLVHDGGPSAVHGRASGAALTLSPERREVTAEIVLPDVTLPRGPIRIDALVSWEGDARPGTRVVIGASSVYVGTIDASGVVQHAGGPVRIEVRLEQPPDAHVSPVVFITGATLTTVTSP